MTTRRDVAAVYPLSPMQEGMLFHALEAPESGVYHTQMVFTVDGDLDVELFRAAWACVIPRHDILRTAFIPGRDGRPLQVVMKEAAVPIDVQDWRERDEPGRATALSEYLAADRLRGFDPRRAPLARVGVVRWSPAEWRVIWSHHHALLDGWSNVLLLKEVWAFYDALAHDRPLTLPAPRPYRDYIAWLRAQDTAESFWRRSLAGTRAPTSLPLGLTAAPRSGDDVREQRIRIDDVKWRRLQAAAARLQVTMNTMVQGAWSLVLSRYSGEAAVLFGATVSGRPAALAGVERMVGLFINTLPVRIDLPAALGAGAWLRALQRTHAEAQQYGYAPLVSIQDWSDIPRGQPLFESLLVFENYPADAFEEGYGPASRIEGGLRVRASGAIERLNYPLTLTAGADANGLLLQLRAAAWRWTADEQSQILRHVAGALEALASDATQPLGALHILTDAEREQLVHWSGRPAAHPHGRHVVAWFEASVEHTPDSIAVACGDAWVSYAALAGRARTLAAALRNAGVRRQDGVGAHLHRGPELMATMLATWYAGAWYLPFDAGWPALRIQQVLDDAGVRVLVTTKALGSRLQTAGCHVIDADEFVGRDAATESLAPYDDELAYVIYTSGSTGRPKGAMVRHGGMVNHLWAKILDFNLDETAVVAQCARASFDVHVWQTLVGLLAGGTVRVIPDDVAEDTQRLIETLAQQRVTLIETVPAQLAVWLDLARAARPTPPLPCLQCVVSNADALPARIGERWHEAYPDILLANAYGPAECTDNVTHARVSPVDDRARAVGYAPLGRPLMNARVYVLDRWGQQTPAGAAGELCIGGVAVGRGYLKRPGLTAERFVPDPFSDRPGSRMYRTGDRSRWRPDGQLEFLGRFDHQVKIRGHRIEVGEVEAALIAHPRVRHALVMLREDTPDMRSLVAYVVTDAGGELLRSWLAERLPRYMMPGAIVVLDAMPLTPHGKVDRRALPAPAPVSAPDSSARPATATESILAGIWETVLQRAPIGPEENFFDLGGHSLLATRILSHVREVFGAELGVRKLFEFPTVRELAAQIARGGGAAVPPLVAVERNGPLPLSFAQQRLWFLDQLHPGLSTYNCPTTLRLQGRVSPGALRGAVQAIVARHEALRTRFPVRDGEPVQIIESSARVPIPLIDLSGLAPVRRMPAALSQARGEASRSFDLAHGPLLRSLIVRISPSDHLLLLTLHHIVSDGWSMGVFIEELAAFYRAADARTRAAVPPLPIQYADYAVWQRRVLEGDVLESELAYWRGQIDGLKVLDLPCDRPQPAVPSARGGRAAIVFEPTLWPRLGAVIRREGVTLFMFLAAAVQLLLARDTGQDDVAVAIPVANRRRLETERLIGFFVNTVVLRTRLAACRTFRDLLAQVRARVLDADAHQDLPFDRLMQEVPALRAADRSLVLRAVVALETHTRRAFSVPDLRVSILEHDDPTVKFDLEFLFAETATGLDGRIEYSTDLFDRDTIERMAERYARLLRMLVEEPESRIWELPLMSGDERELVLRRWNPVSPPAPPTCVHHGFEAVAAERPDAVAVACDSHQLSYEALNSAANRLARHLRQAGVKAGDRVAFCLPRGVELVASLLAIVKTGAAYVPLSPDHPPAHLAFVLADAQVRTMITTTDIAAARPFDGVQRICLDTARDAIRACDDRNLALPVDGSHVAYITYTSGSTGQPKGTEVPHRAIRGFFTHVSYATFDAEQTFLQHSSILWDALTLELWPSLMTGARCVLMPSLTPSPEHVGEAIQRYQVTTVWLTAALFSCIVDTIPAALAGVRQILTGGEVLSARHVMRAMQMVPGVRIVNGYGPSECTVFAACHPIPADTRTLTSVPIGRPIGDRRVLVLDRHANPVPVGIVGEICIGGPAVAHGYLRRPRLTAEKFVPDPFGAEPGSRLYRTGDRGRWLRGGDLAFHGRIDQQMKIRGLRIEPEEIEAALGRQPSVNEAVVAAQENASGQQHLVAYIVPRADRAIDRHELRVSLREALPEYMIPSVFVVLASLPRTGTGKVDRRALPAPDAADWTTASYVAPRTRTEEVVGAVWSDLLGVERVGADDNFFDLGGHSLAATRMVSRLRQMLGCDLPLRLAFERPTVAAMAAEIDRRREGSGARRWSRPMRRSASADRALLARIAELSESDVDALVAQMDGSASAASRSSH